jgi:hypothetical protein
MEVYLVSCCTGRMMEMNECLPQSVPRRILLKKSIDERRDWGEGASIEIFVNYFFQCQIRWNNINSHVRKVPKNPDFCCFLFFLMRIIIIIIFDFWFASSSVIQTNIRPTADTTFSSQYKAMLFKDETFLQIKVNAKLYQHRHRFPLSISLSKSSALRSR